MSFKVFRTGRTHWLSRSLAVAGVTTMLTVASGDAAAFRSPQSRQTTKLSPAAGGSIRGHRQVSATATAAKREVVVAHSNLAAAVAMGEAQWDVDTGVPLRMWGTGIAVPGVIADALAGERTAKALLVQHLSALAPGSRPDDFVVVGNDLSGGIRSIGLAQHHAGRPVLGGQISFRFKHDRLVMIGSEALPDVHVALTQTPITAKVARTQAQAWVAGAAGLAAHHAVADTVEGPFILPLVSAGAPGSRGTTSYHEVLRVTVDSHGPTDRLAVYVDAATGQVIASNSLLHFASGSVQFRVPLRGPQSVRGNFAAPLLSIFVDGLAAATDIAGNFQFPGPQAAIVAGVTGQLLQVINEAGPSATRDFNVNDGEAALWSDESEELEAQLSMYIHGMIVKDRVRTIAPDFAYLDQLLEATVNIDDVCNAFSTGDSIFFFSAGSGCENTALLADVVYHEYGHSVHIQSLIPGVGLFDGSVSEGIADFLSATITGDSGLAPGFFINQPEAPLRELDPVGTEWTWPDDLNGSVHDEGRIIGGTLWDLRKALVEKLGPEAGVRQVDKIWFESIRRAVDIPSMYPEALLADDDDGNLGNGTPNECEINVAFAAHGLLAAGSSSGTVQLLPPTPGGIPVQLTVSGQSKPCVDLVPTQAVLRVRTAGGTPVSLPMQQDAQGFIGFLPDQPDDTLLEYQVTLGFSDNSTTTFPQNPADTWYQRYYGPVQKLYCTDFTADPTVEGWTLTGEWAWGVPGGLGGDPSTPRSGPRVLGTNLQGAYSPLASSEARGPTIPTAGFTSLRLQYWRWLTVEDGVFDRARIRVNNQTVWENLATDSANTHHRDREWRFHDVDLTPFAADGSVQVSFTLDSDEGLEFGGWNVDAVCLVGVNAVAPPVCGNGLVEPGEACDTGPANSDVLPDACRTTCVLPACGDAVVDSAEQCDDGNLMDGDGCSSQCVVELPPATTVDIPTTGPSTVSDSDTFDTENTGDTFDTDDTGDTAGLDGDLADRGCACDSPGRQSPPVLLVVGLGLLLGRRRRRQTTPRA